MKKNVICLFLTYVAIQPVSATCYKCEEIREHNKNLPPLKYEYYDDYLEALKAEGKPLPTDIDFGEETNTDMPPNEEKR